MNIRFQLIIPMIVAMTLFMEFLDITIINTSIPTIAKSFSIEPILLKFAVASYYLSLAVFIPISGWCTDRFGTRSMYTFSVFIFIISSLFCGISHSIVELSVFRFLQGIGGAFMIPAARIILLKSFPSSELIRIQSITYAPALVGNAVGPFLGGVITTYFGWPWIFYINIPIGILMMYLGIKYIKQVTNINVKSFDLFGFLIAGSALFLITIYVQMYNYNVIPSKIIIISGLMGLGLFIYLLIHCSNQKDAIFDFTLFKIKSLRVGFIVYFATSAIYASISFLLPIIFQNYMYFSPNKSGLLIVPIAVGTIIARIIASKFIYRFGFKNCIIYNLIVFMIMIIQIAQINRTTSVYLIVFYGLMLGASMIMINSCVGALNYIDVLRDKISVVTSMDITSRQVSASLGIGMSAFIFTLISQHVNTASSNTSFIPFQYTLYFLSVVILIAIYNTTNLSRDIGKVLTNKISRL